MKSDLLSTRIRSTMLRGATLAAALGLVVACGGGATQAPPPEDPSLEGDPGGGSGGAVKASSAKVQQGMDAIQAGDFAAAETVLSEAREANPDDPQAAFYLGVTYEGLEDFESAKRMYREALELDPELPDAAVNLSAVLLEVDKKPDSALKILKLALDANPDHAGLLLNMALTQQALGDWEKAAKYYGRLVKMAPDKLELQLDYAIALHKAGKSAAAVKPLAQAAKSKDVGVLAPAARLYGMLEDYGKCVETFDKALKVKKLPELLVRRGLCKGAAGNLDAAILDFNEALNIDSEYAPAHLHLGLTFQKQEKKDEAKRALGDAVKYGKGPIKEQAEKALSEL